MRTLLVILLLTCGLPGCLWAAEGHSTNPFANAKDFIEDEGSLQKEFQSQIMVEAADYQVNRAEALPKLDEAYHSAAAVAAMRASRLLEQGSFVAAHDAAANALEDYPFANAAPQLRHVLLRVDLATGALERAREQLSRLMHFHPEYPLTGLAMLDTLATAETHLNAAATLPLQAMAAERVATATAAGKPLADPESLDLNALVHSDARNTDVSIYGVLRLFNWLSVSGDRQTVAPRAAMGRARARLLMAGTSARHLLLARLAYEDVLIKHADTDLVFDALIERALSRLRSYTSSDHDVGALTMVEQSDLRAADAATKGKPERIWIVQSLRATIVRLHQEHDLASAAWYRGHGHSESARVYYQQVIARDADSPPARTAAGLLAELGEPPKQPLLEGAIIPKVEAKGDAPTDETPAKDHVPPPLDPEP